jgi:hypothetical protein
MEISKLRLTRKQQQQIAVETEDLYCCDAISSDIRTLVFSSVLRVFMRYLHDLHKISLYLAEHVCLSVRTSGRIPAWFSSRSAGQIWIKFGMDGMPLVSALKSYFLIVHNRQYQHCGLMDLWSGSDTSATCSRAVQWGTITDLRKIHNIWCSAK